MQGIPAQPFRRRVYAQARALAPAAPRAPRFLPRALCSISLLTAFAAAPVFAQPDAAALPAERIEQLLGQAREQLDAGQYEEAISTATQVYQFEVDNPDAQRLINEARQRATRGSAQPQEQTESAPAEVDEAAAEAANDQAEAIADRLRDGERALRRERYTDARAAAEEVLSVDPQNSTAQDLLSQVEAAEVAARQSQEIAAQEDRVEQLLDQTRASLRDDDYAGAEAAAQQVLEIDQANADAQELLVRVERERNVAVREQTEGEVDQLIDSARDSLSANDFDGATAAANQVLALDPENSAAQGVLREVQSVQDEAANNEAIAQRNAQVQQLLDSAQAQLDAGDNAGAITTLQEAQQLDPENRRVARYLRRAEDGAAEAQQLAAQQAAEQEEAAQRLAAEQTEAERQAAAERAEREQAEQARLEAEQAEQERQLAAQAAAERESADAAVRQQQEIAADEAREGQRALDRGNLESAQTHFNASLAAVPNYEPAVEGLAALDQAASQQQQVEQARAQADAEVVEGYAALDAENYGGAQAHFQAALAIDPDHSGAQEGLESISARQRQAVEVAQVEVQTVTEAGDSANMAASDALVDEARVLAESGDLLEAENRLREALSLWSENPRARRALARVQAQIVEATPVTETTVVTTEGVVVTTDADADTQALIDGLLQEGRDAYSAGDVITAVDRWTRVIDLDPNNDYALTYLQNTEAEYQGAVALASSQSEQLSREVAINDKLASPISITTPTEGTPLQLFLENISLITEINFVISDGVDVTVVGSFVEQPLQQVLDSVITSNGLTWSIEGGIITIRPNLQTRVYQLSSDDAASLKVFRDSGMLDQLLYPPDGVSRVAGEAYQLDDITGTFVVTGSQAQIERIDHLVADLSAVTPTVVVTRIFRVRPEEGERIRTLVESILEAERTPQTEAFDRRIILQGENLIVRATDPEIRRVEEILQEYGGEGEGLGDLGLDVATFSLIPRRVLQQNEEIARDLATSIVETVTTLLYSQEGVEAARRQGRRLWFDEFTLQLTITDTPENIDRVTRYISSIPVLEPRRITRIVNLDHQQASTIRDKLAEFLDIEIRGSEGGNQQAQGGGDVVVRTLRADDEFTFRDIRITLVNVVENDINNDRDEDVTMLIDTLTSSEERTLQELRSEIVDDYRIRIVDARAGAEGRGNSGRAEIEVTFLGAAAQGVTGGGNFQAIPATEGIATGQQGVGGQTGQAGGPGEADEVQSNLEDDRIPIITADDDTNSLLISVVNPGDLSLIEEAIDLLDTPILQAQIETKFVEVNENRARELKSEMSLSGIGQEGINFSDSFFSARYAQDTDEFRNVFEPSLESPTAANLPKAATVLTLITGGRSPLTWELAFLEAEGVINTVNGPFITAQNNQGAEFTITQEFSRLGALAGVNLTTGGGTQGGATNTNVTTLGNGANLANIELVNMDVTPTISQSGYITLDLDVEISNFTNNLGQAVGRGGTVNNIATGAPTTLTLQDTAIANIFGVYSNNLKELQTTARVRDGGTIVLGGWTLERATQTSSGIPVLRNLPYVGHVFFSRNQDLLERLTLLIFLTARIIDVE